MPYPLLCYQPLRPLSPVTPPQKLKTDSATAIMYQINCSIYISLTCSLLS